MGVELGREVGDDGCMGGDHVRGCWGGRLAVTAQILALPAPWVLQRRGQGENWRELRKATGIHTLWRWVKPAPRLGFPLWGLA